MTDQRSRHFSISPLESVGYCDEAQEQGTRCRALLMLRVKDRGRGQNPIPGPDAALHEATK